MATELGTAYLQIMPSAQGMQGNLSKMMGKEGDSAGITAGKSFAGKLKGILAAAGIGAAVKKSLDIGGALEQSLGGLDTIYGEASAAAKNYAKEAYQAGISQNSYAEQAVSFGAALKQAYAGDTAKAVEAANTAILDMTDNAAKMGTPIENIQNAYQGFAKQNYTMLDNLKLGYGGTKSEMERLLADASKLSGVEYNIDNLGDVYDAIHVIQEDLGLTGVAAAEAAGTFSGSFGAMKAAAENFMGSLMLGEDVGASMSALVETAVTFVGGNLIPAIGRIFASLPEAIMTGIDTIHPLLLEGLSKATEAVKANFPQMLQGALEGLLSFSETIRSNAGQLVDAGLTFIKSIADGIITNIPVFIQTVPTIISNFAGIINDNAPKILTTGLTIIKNLAIGLIKAIPVLIANLPKILMAIWDVFTAFQWLNLGKLLIEKIGSGIVAAGKGIGNAVKGILTNTKSTITSGFSSLKGIVSSIWNGIKTAITHPIQTAVGLVKTAIGKIKAVLSGKISLPHIKLPHFSISGKFSLNPPSIPKIGVNWYRKAEGTPYLFRKATAFDMSVAGEGRDEILYGRSNLMRDIKEATGTNGNRPVNIINNFTVNGAESPETWAMKLASQLELQMRTI